jgi:sortase A
VANLDEDQYAHLWVAAEDYNRSLLSRDNPYLLDETQGEEYWELLNVAGNGIMGYIDIPSIKVQLPVYHGTSESILSIAIGHLEWTSLPTGGESTHCVVSGHRGLPSARLFTDLDKVTVGDIFLLNILDETLTYEVDQIKIVEPFDTSDLLITEGEDYVTLVTCTPYGINSHRMLVRGTRIANIEEVKIKRVTADAVQIEPLLVAPLLATPILLVLLIMILLPKHNKNRRNDP